MASSPNNLKTPKRCDLPDHVRKIVICARAQSWDANARLREELQIRSLNTTRKERFHKTLGFLKSAKLICHCVVVHGTH